MRILLDEPVPRGVKRLLPGHDVITVRERGWTSKENGEPLALASAEFDVFVTADQSHGKPAGLLGFEGEDDRFDYRLERDPQFLARIERARRSLRQGKGKRIEEIDETG